MTISVMDRVNRTGCFSEYEKYNKACMECEFRKPCEIIMKANSKEPESTLMSRKVYINVLRIIADEGCRGISCLECPVEKNSHLCIHLVTLSHQDGDY